MGLSFNFFSVGSAKRIFSARLTFRPFKVIQGFQARSLILFGMNRKLVCDFLLVRHSNRFRYCRFSAPHPYFTLILSVPVDQIAHVEVSPSINLGLKLISRKLFSKY